MNREAIAALSTPRGRGGIAVIRISGEGITGIVEGIIEGGKKSLIHSQTRHSYILNGSDRIEECLITYFKEPFSYTGEDLIEISVHSNPHLVEKILEIIFSKGARPALHGEFTLRAYRNGKMDLIQAESVNDLINANSRYFAEMKFGNLEGKLSRFLDEIKKDIINSLIKIETIIEFNEDQKLTGNILPQRLSEALRKIRNIISTKRANKVMDNGPVIVIVGKVNTGKSSLFNRILLEERSIISEEPGTTRDFIRERIYIRDLPVELVDVAGVNVSPAGVVERKGIERGIDIIRDSTAVIFMLDASEEIDKNDRKIHKLLKKKDHIIVLNKTDKRVVTNENDVKKIFPGETVISVSVLKDKNIESILDFITGIAEEIIDSFSEISVNLRQKDLLGKLYNILKETEKDLSGGKKEPELLAEDLRTGLRFIGELLGEVQNEEILSGIFGKFCIGK